MARVLPELVIHAPATPEQRMAAARMAEKSDRPELAIDLLEALIRRNVATRESRLMLAGLYLHNDEVEEAERVIRGAGGDGLSGVEGLRLLARTQRRLEKWDELAVTLHGILAEEPDNTEVARELGMLLSDLNRPLEAHKYLTLALPAFEEDAELRVRLADAALARRKPDEALRQLERLQELAPGHPAGRALKTRVLQQAQRWEELTEHLERIVAESPGDAEARHKLVTAYLNRFEQDKAREHFEALERLSPSKARLLRQYFR